MIKETLFICLVILFSCKESQTLNREVFKEKEKVIPIANDEYDLSYLTIVKEYNDTTYLFRKSRYSNSVYVYDWDNKKRINKIDYRSFGPNRIVNFAQGAILPLDRNYFFIGTINNIYETVLDSVIYHATVIESTKKSKKNIYDNSESFFTLAQNHFPPFKLKNKIYCRLGASNGNLGTDAFYDSKILMEYDLNNKQYRKMKLSYPWFYFNNCWGPDRDRYSMTLNRKEELICMFPVKPRIYKYSLYTETIIDSVDFKSDYASSDLKPVNCKYSSEKKMYHAFSNPLFRSIKYDKYRKIYYIFVQLPIDIKTYKSVKNPFTLNPFSIIVLDENFKKIGEQKFKGGIYHTSDFFVTKEGLWLSKNSPHNPNYNENQLRFSLLTLKDEN